MELATQYLNHIATRKLGWKTPHECHFGETQDLLVFHVEMQQDGSQLLLKGADRVYQEMIKRLEACEAEEIIIGNQRATYEGTDEGTGYVIWKMVHTRHCLLRKYTTI